MKTIFFLFTHDAIQNAVKEETSLLAERRPDSADPTALYNDQLVMDEEYDTLFRRLFQDSHAEIITHISSNYLADTPTDIDAIFSEFPDFSEERDFALWLTMHDDFPSQYIKSTGIKLKQFVIDYICWRWLETKAPNEAVSYYNRTQYVMKDVKELLIRKINPIRRYPSFP